MVAVQSNRDVDQKHDEAVIIVQAYLWCELIHASDRMRSRCIQQGIARVVLQTGKCPQHIRQGLRVELLQQNEQLSQINYTTDASP